MDEERNNYVARKSCGCIVGAIGLDCSPRDIASALAGWTKAGLIIDRATDDDVRNGFTGWSCPHEAKQEALFAE